MKLCQIKKAGDTVFVPISDHKSEQECRQATKKLGDGDYVAARFNKPFRVTIENIPKATVENIVEPKENTKPKSKE